MMVGLEPDLDRSMSRRWATKADDVRVKRTIAALEANGITALRAADLAEAKRLVLELIPEGSEVHSGASQSLQLAGAKQESERETIQQTRNDERQSPFNRVVFTRCPSPISPLLLTITSSVPSGLIRTSTPGSRCG